MLYFTADNMGGSSGMGLDACNTCCCQSINLRPGSINKMTLDWAPWSLEIAPPGIVPEMQWNFELNDSSCSDAVLDGFGPPEFTPMLVTMGVGDTEVSGTMVPNFYFPGDNTPTFEIVPLQGPVNGGVEITNAGEGSWTYTPRPGYRGWDWFWIKATDSSGRTAVGRVLINVANQAGSPPWYISGPQSEAFNPKINAGGVIYDQKFQRVSFQLWLPPSCRPCETWRLTVQQPAKDCDGNVYTNEMCFDIRCGKC